jgi:hypothetical protein
MPCFSSSSNISFSIKQGTFPCPIIFRVTTTEEMVKRDDDLSTDIAGYFLTFSAGYSVASLFLYECYIATGATAHESTSYKGLKLVVNRDGGG